MEVSAQVRELMQGGCGLIVGLVTPEGRPFATRAVGFDFLPDGRARLLLDRHDAAELDLAMDEPLDQEIAITGAHIVRMDSVQVKGRLRRLLPGTEADERRATAYCDEFIDDVVATDEIPREIMDRWRPDGVVAAEIDVRDLYDQTPGPGAGARLAGGGPDQ